jgi:uncharacterized protein YciI
MSSSLRGGAARQFAYCLKSLAHPTIAAMSAHRAYLRTLEAHGNLIAGGPFRGGGGAVVCLFADDEDDADQMARADPLVAFGFMVYQLREIDRIERVARADA